MLFRRFSFCSVGEEGGDKPELLLNAAAMASMAERSPCVAMCFSEKRARKRSARLSLESSQRILRSSRTASELVGGIVMEMVVDGGWYENMTMSWRGRETPTI